MAAITGTGDILVVGATGNQGRAVIAALSTTAAPASASASSCPRILALTRNASSPGAKSLAEKYPNVTLVEGDTRQAGTIFSQHPNIASIFLVTVPSDEMEQARPVIEAAVASTSRVKHIVFSSVDRGGDAESWTNRTNVAHFAAKHDIELLLRQRCEDATAAGKQVRWTILRPAGFMDNYSPGFFGRMMASLWSSGMPHHHRMQLVSTHDIGVFAAKALLNPTEWAGKAVGLAGDDLNFLELQEAFTRATGQELPQTYSLLGQGILWASASAKSTFAWFLDEGCKVDIKALREQEPRLQTFEMWLTGTSKWKNQS